VIEIRRLCLNSSEVLAALDGSKTEHRIKKGLTQGPPKIRSGLIAYAAEDLISSLGVKAHKALAKKEPIKGYYVADGSPLPREVVWPTLLTRCRAVSMPPIVARLLFHVSGVRCEAIGDLDDAAARREGYQDLRSLRGHWLAKEKRWIPEELIWVVKLQRIFIPPNWEQLCSGSIEPGLF